VDLEWVCSCFEPQGDVFWTLKSCLLMTPTNETFLWVGVDLEWAGVDLEWAGVDLEWAFCRVDLGWIRVQCVSLCQFLGIEPLKNWSA
jgi:hypothetical protein